MGASREFVRLDHRGRVALRRFARGHEEFLLTVDDQGVIRLAPAEILELPKPPPVRKRVPRGRAVKKAASAAAERPQKREDS